LSIGIGLPSPPVPLGWHALGLVVQVASFVTL
jgi:hypothetical protein